MKLNDPLDDQSKWVTLAQITQLSIKGVPGRTQNVFYFVAHQFLDLRPSWAQIFSWIELLRVFRKGLANGRCHGQAQICVDVNLRAANSPGDLNISLWNARRVFAHVSTVFVDL